MQLVTCYVQLLCISYCEKKVFSSPLHSEMFSILGCVRRTFASPWKRKICAPMLVDFPPITVTIQNGIFKSSDGKRFYSPSEWILSTLVPSSGRVKKMKWGCSPFRKPVPLLPMYIHRITIKSPFHNPFQKPGCPFTVEFLILFRLPLFPPLWPFLTPTFSPLKNVVDVSLFPLISEKREAGIGNRRGDRIM